MELKYYIAFLNRMDFNLLLIVLNGIEMTIFCKIALGYLLLIVLNGIEIFLYRKYLRVVLLLIVLNGIEIYHSRETPGNGKTLLIVLNGIEIRKNNFRCLC